MEDSITKKNRIANKNIRYQVNLECVCYIIVGIDSPNKMLENCEIFGIKVYIIALKIVGQIVQI